MGGVRPDPKPRKRFDAPAQEWTVLRQIKQEENEVCEICATEPWTELHHIVPRSQSGDDWLSNLMALCHDCHEAVTLNRPEYLMMLRWALTTRQTFYVVKRKGYGWLEAKYPAVMAL